MLRTIVHEEQERPSERLVAWLEDLPCPAVMALDPSCERIVANPTARAAFHLASGTFGVEALPDARFRFFNDRVTTKAPALPLATAIAENRTIGPVAITLARPGSETIATRIITAPIHGADGAPAGAISLFLDVDRRDRPATDLRVLAETIPHFVWICSPGGRLSYCNQRLLLYSGLPLAEVLKAPSFISLLYAEDRDRVRRSWIDATGKGSDAFEAECRIADADGTPRWFLLRAKPLRNGSATAAYWFGTATDVQAQKEAERSAGRSEASFRTLTDTLSEFIYRIGSDGVRTFVNHGFADYAGDSNDDAAFAQRLHPRDRDRIADVWDDWRKHRQAVDVEFRLRGRDDTYRWFVSRRRPVIDRDGHILEWVGSITDIHAGKIAQRNSQLLSEVAGQFSNDRRLEESLQRVAGLCAATLDAVCIIELLADGKPVRVAGAHPDATVDPAIRALLDEAPRYAQGHPIMVALRTGKVQCIEPHVARMILGSRLPVGSGITVPLTEGDRTLGILTLLRDAGGGASDDPADLQLTRQVARRISQRIASAHMLERERKLALEFQRAALPLELPQLPGIDVTVSYVAGKDEAAVGGDWYDVFTISDGSVVITIGDVAGSGSRAAVIMAQLRYTIRALMHSDSDPRSVAVHTDAVLRSEYADVFATAFIGVFCPQTRDLHYVRCGHPSPFLRTLSGDVVELDAEPNLPIGLMGLAPGPPTATVRIPTGARLVCYTDGLIEAERKPLDGLRSIRRALADEDTAADASAILRTILQGTVPVDDTVVMTLHFS